MQDRKNFPELVGEDQASLCTERRRGSFGRECRKNSTYMPKVESKGKFMRKGVTLHIHSMDSYQRQRMRESKRDKERERVKSTGRKTLGLRERQRH